MIKFHFTLIFCFAFFLSYGGAISNQLSNDIKTGEIKVNVKKIAPEPVKWDTEIRELIFDDDDELKDGSHFMELFTPYRAADAAIVPISIKFRKNQNEEDFVKYITIVADENPSPIIGKFEFSLKTGKSDFSTRIRIDKYTYVRAIAEMNNGEKYMVSNYVKAAGGCSAPSLADMDTVMARLGKMKMKLIETGEVGQLNKAQFIISHPNFSGLQFNQLTRSEIPAHFVDSIKVMQDNETILNITSDISLSEDPSFTFHYLNTGGELDVTVTDSLGEVYTNKWPIEHILSSK